MSTQPQALSLIHDEGDLREHLQPVCVGASILGYSYARCFVEAYGIKPILISGIDVKVTSSSRFCEYRLVPGIEDESVLVPYLCNLGRQLEQQGKCGLLQGSVDWNARIISAHKEELSQWFVVPYIDFDLLDRITQKEEFYRICDQLGIAYPRTWYLDCSDKDYQLDTSAFPYPLIAKPSNSAAYDLLEFPGKKKIYEIETPDELRRAFDAVRSSGYDHKLIVQDFVPGDDDAIRSLTTFSDAQGNVRVVAGGRVVLQDHSPLALGNPVCILSEKVQKIVDDATRFVKHVGYHGYANFDIKYDSRDGSYRFFEVNTRPGANTYYVTLGGVNFVKPIVEDWVLGRELPYQEAYDPYVYTLIPKKIVQRTVADEALRDQVLSMYASGQAHSPLFCSKDTLKHQIWARLMWDCQVSKFKKYVWDTNGKQADVD